MNTRKLFYGLFVIGALIFASCTVDNADDGLYEQGVDKSKITKPAQSVDKSKITKPTSVDKSKVSYPKKRSN